MKTRRNDFMLRAFRFSAVVTVCGIGFWQFARSGFDWGAVLDTPSPSGFFFAMASLPIFGFPISACYIYAGYAFSPLTAAGLCLGALCVNLSVSYALAHSVFRKPIRCFLARRDWRIPELSDQNQFRFTFLMRTIPGPPFFFQNLALSLAGIPFRTYLWVSLLTQGGIAIGVILCSRYLSQDPWGKGGATVMVILVCLLVARGIKAIKDRQRMQKEVSFEAKKA